MQSLGDWLVLALGTGLFVGMIPPRTATIATLWGIPLAIGLHHAVGWIGYVPALIALWLSGIAICGRAATVLGRPDPREITYDEFTTLPMVYFLTNRFSLSILIAGFLLHRVFDITKPFGIRRVERLGGGLGIMADDVLAALAAFAVMRLLDAAQCWPFLAGV